MRETNRGASKATPDTPTLKQQFNGTIARVDSLVLELRAYSALAAHADSDPNHSLCPADVAAITQAGATKANMLAGELRALRSDLWPILSGSEAAPRGSALAEIKKLAASFFHRPIFSEPKEAHNV